jgi:hypothetical protein
LESPKQQVEIAFYSFTPVKSTSLWESKQRQVKSRLEQESKPIQEVNKEVATLESLCKQGKILRPQIEDRLAELNRRKNISTNSASYWNIVIMDRVMTLKQNLLMITTVTKK